MLKRWVDKTICQNTDICTENGECFKHIRNKFSKLSDTKVKKRIIVGPDIRRLMEDEEFVNTMKTDEKEAWLNFQSVSDIMG